MPNGNTKKSHDGVSTKIMWADQNNYKDLNY